MAHSTDSFLRSNKYPAKSHCARVADYLKRSSDSAAGDAGVIYLESSRAKLWPNSDQEAPLRQDRYFYYLTGCELADCHLIYDLSKHRSTLFIPPVVDEEVIWSGLPLSPTEALKR